VYRRRGHSRVVEHHGPAARVQWATLSLACVLALAWAPSAWAAGPFSKLASAMTAARESAVSAPLPDGDVLIAGGVNHNGYVTTAEVFDSTTKTFEALTERPIALERVNGVAAPLPDGKVLIVGGHNEFASLTSAELFDPATGKFEALSNAMATSRISPIAVALSDGKVLIAGGGNGTSAELFDPATETFEVLSAQATVVRERAVAAPLPGGDVLIAGGGEFFGVGSASAELFDPATETFQALPNEMTVARDGAVAATLPDGQVLLAGGSEDTKGAELFNPATQEFEALDAEATGARVNAIAAALPNGTVLIAGGGNGGQPLSTAEVVSSPAPAVVLSGGTFGDQALGAHSASQTILVDSVGPSALFPTGATLSGPQASAFTIEQDTCAGTRLAFEQICTIAVSFTPAVLGSSSATLTLADNEPTPSAIALSGTGVPVNSGSTGPTGATGPPGGSGATGPTGPRGVTGAKGAVQIVTCYTTMTSRHPSGHKTQANHRVCSTVSTSAPRTFAGKAGAARVKLEHGHRVYAVGTGILNARGRLELLLSDSRALKPGGYTLTLVRRQGARWVTTRLQVTLG
jgi:WD40 repeat protein